MLSVYLGHLAANQPNLMTLMKKMLLRLLAVFIVNTALFATSAAHADQPRPWEMMMQAPGSTSFEHIQALHNMLLYIIAGIVLFVLTLLAIVIVRFNEKANPIPSERAHHVLLEVFWTVIPALILVVVAVPSFKLIYYTDRTPKPEMTLKVTAYQWYWGYEYPDQGGINFLANRIPDKEIDKSKGQVRLLSTDNVVVLPVDTNIQILMTGADVIHDWGIPALGMKIDAVPGRVNETWLRITKPGTYYGQCDQVCGANHSFMPIEIHAVSKDEFKTWLVTAKKQYSSLTAPDGPIRLASIRGTLE